MNAAGSGRRLFGLRCVSYLVCAEHWYDSFTFFGNFWAMHVEACTRDPFACASRRLIVNLWFDAEISASRGNVRRICIVNAQLW